MTLFMRLLHYPGRQNIKYYGAQTLGFLLFMTVCLNSRIITNELWAGTGTKPTICCPPVYFPWQTSNDPSVTFCCPKNHHNSHWGVYLIIYVSRIEAPFSAQSVYLSMWCQPLPLPRPPQRCVPMAPVICVTTGHFVSSLCQISLSPPLSIRPP